MSKNRRRIDRVSSAEAAKDRGPRLLRAALALTSMAAIGTGLLYAGTGAHRFLTTSPTFAVEKIVVKGNHRASTDELLTRSGLGVGQNLFLADVDTAVAGMQQAPWVKSVAVHRSLPHTLTVEVAEREPALLVALDKLYFADAEGVLCKRALPGDDLDLPVVTGMSRTRYQDQRAQTETAIKNLAELAQAYDAKLGGRGRVEELSADDEGNVSVVTGKGLVTVSLGVAPYAPKLEKLEQLWTEFDRRGVQPQTIHLDNRARPNWVAVKLADAALAPPSKGKKP
jgi:cell division protein FtsQ